MLDIQKSSYYYWQGHRQPMVQRQRLQVHAKAVHTETRQTYGSRRMSAALRAQGLDVGALPHLEFDAGSGLGGRYAPRNAIAIRQVKYHASPTTTLIATSR